VKNAAVGKVATRAMAGSPAPWNYMWKPGPYPINDEERVAAAKKYGMLLEDYKPNEDMDAMMGDYPNLPVEPQAEKNALYEWDCPEYRRNYGEPLQEEWWKYQEIRFSPMRQWRWTKREVYTAQFKAFLFICFAYIITDGEYGIPRLTQCRAEQQLACDGPHYTFEAAE